MCLQLGQGDSRHGRVKFDGQSLGFYANDISSKLLRSKALQKVALLSARPTKNPHNSDLTRLYNACDFNRLSPDGRSLSQSPIGHAELDVLFALCHTAHLLDDLETADRLLKQLSPYLLEAHTQAIAPSPFLCTVEPSPWEALGHNLTSAVLAIGLRHPSLHHAVVQCTSRYLHNCLRAVNSASSKLPRPEDSTNSIEAEGTLELAAVSVSLLGFLEAASVHAEFYNVTERLDLVHLLRQILDENLMVSVEGVFSSIRTSGHLVRVVIDWKAYTKRYAASGRPLGAMLLQRGFMKLLVSCSSLQICTAQQLKSSDVFDVLISNGDFTLQEQQNDSTALTELVTDLAAESMRLLEDGSDYLQLGSAWQQRLAFAVKAHTLNTFLNCMVVDEDIADSDILLSWLEDAMADPVQMADDTLACVVLKSMAVIARFSPAIASSLSRSLPRFVVQGGIKGETVIVAARSLTFILRMLSQDAVITGLYSLGNVLSAQSATDRPLGGSEANGTANYSKATAYSQQSNGSAISLDLSGDEETAAAYGNVVRTMVSIATICQDDKITALAQSMLLQKLGRVSLAVDLHITMETAKLAAAGGPTEFNSLLKLYARLGHDAVVGRNSTILESVRLQTLYSYIVHSHSDTDQERQVLYRKVPAA